MNLSPTICNICNGKVIYTSNSLIYGREYGSGKMYYCTECGAYVGTHIPRPTEAFGILANKEMRELKSACHRIFDEQWLHEPTGRKKCAARNKAYKRLADALSIPVSECHFGYFDMNTLRRAMAFLKGGLYLPVKLKQKEVV